MEQQNMEQRALEVYIDIPDDEEVIEDLQFALVVWALILFTVGISVFGRWLEVGRVHLVLIYVAGLFLLAVWLWTRRVD
ncbi:hypothetical protein QBC37DRAFT_377038 [Rhypophila decipiens]|uniref:Uncharacterized protein n=1 Tax=Rhypophila decipiens TaxID=261697 RepID=A0AAN6Y6R9_9PEZI|nr:hypothetical protein QBC37DRAFT_377038 [Rhypophila decipiens]